MVKIILQDDIKQLLFNYKIFALFPKETIYCKLWTLKRLYRGIHCAECLSVTESCLHLSRGYLCYTALL